MGDAEQLEINILGVACYFTSNLTRYLWISATPAFAPRRWIFGGYWFGGRSF